jgi:hypothetical protein
MSFFFQAGKAFSSLASEASSPKRAKRVGASGGKKFLIFSLSSSFADFFEADR